MENLTKLFENHVKKQWGDEYWIINTPDKCFKLMLIQPGKYGSLHYHKVKAESFKVLRGVMYIDIQRNAGYPAITGVKIGAGDREIIIRPQQLHKFYTIDEPCLVLEESTFHSDDDTYREEASRDMTEEEIERLREG